MLPCQELGMDGFQTEAGGFVHDKPGVGITGFQVFTTLPTYYKGQKPIFCQLFDLVSAAT